MIKDDMAIHAGIPQKAVNAAFKELRAEESLSEVTWETAKVRSGWPIKIYFEAASMNNIHAAKQRLEQILDANGFDLYPSSYPQQQRGFRTSSFSGTPLLLS